MMTTIHTDYKHSLATSGDEEDNERSGDTLVGSSIRSQDIRKDAASAVSNDKEKPRSSRKRRAPSLSGLTSSSAASSTFQSMQRSPSVLSSSSSSFLMPAATMSPQSLSPVPASPSSPFGQQQEQQHRFQCYSHLGSLPAPPIPDLLADFFQHYPPRNKNSARTRNALAATSASAATRVRMEESKTPNNDITTTYIYNDHENDAYDYATREEEEELFSAMAEERPPPSSHELEMIHASILANDDRLNREIDELFGAFGEEDIY